MSFLFPEPPRDFPGRRLIKVSLRTLHILTTSVLLGGCFFAQSREDLRSWIWASIISGLLFLALDIHATCTILFEVRGAVVILKIVLVGLLPQLWELRIPLLVAALILGALSSHLSAEIRHYVLFSRARLVPDRRRG